MIVNDINMKFLVVVAPPSIYHGCSTRKKFWKEKFTGKKQDFFESMNMRDCGQRNARKNREFKDSDERVTMNMNEILKISEKFDSLNKMQTTSSKSKENWKDQERGWLPLWVLRPK